MKKLFLLSIIFLSGYSFLSSQKQITELPDQNGGGIDSLCTADAMICPDGSSVSRMPPPCTFKACPKLGDKKINTLTIPNAHSAFTFSSTIPTNWEVETIPAINSLNIFDPNAEGNSNLEKSQIFIRYFSASRFLTLSTVTIHSQKNNILAGRPAVIYDIEKKKEIANFPSQPTWRNERHIVTDIRSTDSNPTIFYVFGKRPDLSKIIFDAFIEDLDFLPKKTSKLIEPIADFKNRITLKPFGIYITPNSSPISPERFSRYHTAVDIEYGDTTSNVPVFTIADGVVEHSGVVSGYGGMVALRHEINNKNYLGIYGHLDSQIVPSIGVRIVKGNQIGILGDGNTAETDGERKHLHFGLYKNSDTNIAGYVSTEGELVNWIDPVELF